MTELLQQSIETPSSGTLRTVSAGTGPPVVLLHRSIGGQSSRDLVTALASQYAVVAPAMPGFDESDRPDWARSPRDLAAIVLHSVVASVERPVLVGLGLGGWIAAEIVVMCPERLAALVLVSPVGLKPTEGSLTDPFLYNTDEYVAMGFASPEQHARSFGEAWEVGSEHAWKQREANREMTTRIAWKPRLFDMSLPHRLPYVTTPTLVLCGDQDRIVPRSATERYRDLIPGAELVVLPECGHMVECEATEAASAAIAAFAERVRK